MQQLTREAAGPRALRRRWSPIERLRQRPELRQLLCFAVVGAIGTLLDVVTLVALKELAGLPTLLANPLSFSVGLVNNFLLNRAWTYPQARRRSAWAQLLRFGLVSVGGALLNTLIVLALEQPLGALVGAPASGYLPAKAIATVVVFFWNFFANRRWTFDELA